MACKRCGSHAINHNAHGRDGSDPDLCDVCYWRKRAEEENEACAKVCDEKSDKEVFLFYFWALMFCGGTLYYVVKFSTRWLEPLVH